MNINRKEKERNKKPGLNALSRAKNSGGKFLLIKLLELTGGSKHSERAHK